MAIMCDTDYVFCEFEDYNGLTFIHVDLKKEWTREAKKQVQNEWELILKNHTNDVNALIRVDDKKLRKFAELYGFEWTQTVEGEDREQYDVYVWRK